MLTAIEILGTFAFATSGAIVAVRKQYDIVGVLVLALAAGLTGGIIRDLLIGLAPPQALRQAWAIPTAASAVLPVCLIQRPWRLALNVLTVFDAVGLATVSVSGSLLALDHHIAPLAAILLGVISGIGGGLARDLLALERPEVLHQDIYALAALLGAALTVLGVKAGASHGLVVTVAACAAFALRITAWRRGWHAPRPAA